MIREDGGRLYVSGPITLRTAMTLLDAMAGHIGRESKVVDFSNVSDVDSSAVSLMLEWSRRARAAGGSVRFACAGEAITSLTNLYGVESLIAFED